MTDIRPCYTMETGFTRSDFTFYKKLPDTMPIGYPEIADLQTRAGVERFYLIDSYIHYWHNGHSSDRVLVLVNDKGLQIETCNFGWKRIPTAHDRALQDKRDAEAFVHALAELKAPPSLRRWRAEVLGMFENEFEDTLYYGEEA